MAQPHLIDPQVVGASADGGSVETDAACQQLVLQIYTAAMGSSHTERGAFDAAVNTYRRRKANLSEPEARLAVARILCGKA